MRKATSQTDSFLDGGQRHISRRQYKDLPMERFFLWIDGVGGYLVCPEARVTIGRAGHPTVDVPILADIASEHLELRRSGEGYLLQAHAASMLDGHPVQQAVLGDRCQIQLGGSVVLGFSCPSPLSLSARLDFLSGHSTVPTTDGVLLLAHSLILSPQHTAHVLCRDWSQEVIVFREDEHLWCRAGEPLRVDGVLHRSAVRLPSGCLVEGREFVFRIEQVANAPR